ncbi:hypothetical protein OSTOST_21521, partial [Ostertagia ostertagi]
ATITIQDCVFRTRGRSDWVATIDLDERISVNGGTTIREYIKQVEGMGVHQVLRFSPGATVLLVPPEDAVVRHYRLTKGWTYFLKEAETFGSFEETYLASSLIEAIQLKANHKVDQLFPSAQTKVYTGDNKVY